MNCPKCQSPYHVAITSPDGKPIPVLRSEHIPAHVASTSGLFKRAFIPAKVIRTEVGSWVKCIDCGTPFFTTPEGVRVPKWAQAPVAPPAPQNNGDAPERKKSRLPTDLDDDMVRPPSM